MGRLKHLAPLVVYTTYIFVAGSVKGGAPPGEMSDKTAHFLAFGLMVLPALLAVSYFRPRLAIPFRCALAAATASVLGALLEVWQLCLPGRSSELLDWVADTAGAITVALAVVAARAVIPERHRAE